MARTHDFHMPDRVNIAAILGGGLGIVAAIAASLVAAFMLSRGPRVVPTAPAIASPIALQPAPERDIEVYRADKQRQLSEYAWVDRDHGIVRIPIDRAMELRARQRNPSP